MPEQDQSPVFLHVENVYKTYGAKQVLDNVDLSVKRGELCTLVGPSGCGKSTLLRLILGQEQATSGTILIEGRRVGYANPDRGIVYQKYSLFPHLSVLDNVLLGKQLSAGLFSSWTSKRPFRDEATHYLERIRLAEHGHKYPHELSGGMQQRVAIAQALIMRPKILLMDEPFGALDPGTREDMQLFLLELWEEFKMTIFFVTHDLEEAVFLGTRILALSQYYTDERGESYENRGAKIAADHLLPRQATATGIKESAESGHLIQLLRREAFDPAYRQHATQFNLHHPDSWQTLTAEEKGA